jgi:hypothetical protein
MSLAQAVSEHCRHQLLQHCRLVASCLLLANHHGGSEEAQARQGGGASASGSGSSEEFDLDEEEEEEEEEGVWDSEEEDDSARLLSEGQGGPAGGHGRGDGFGGRGAGGVGGQHGHGRHGHGGGEGGLPHGGGLASLKMDLLSLTFALPSAERAFQLHYSANMLKVRWRQGGGAGAAAALRLAFLPARSLVGNLISKYERSFPEGQEGSPHGWRLLLPGPANMRGAGRMGGVLGR